METFTDIKPLVDHSLFPEQREKALAKLDMNTIDTPIFELINQFAKLPVCFTLQSCYGHFVYKNQNNPKNIEPLPDSADISSVVFRIAYIALCIQNSARGKILLEKLSHIPSVDPEYVQFGCAEWFWKKQVNSYALQVEPKRYQTQDKVSLDYKEAIHIEKIRNAVFLKLKTIIHG
ncbi:MAG: hypothetical protein HKO79_14505 [Desulfobacterales bacterium]|nr:hypothetical protein [Deltaproteobacteria bacterium]NNL43695.1 hypothetical protein [Desulfobacterales bacterium]